MPLSLSHPPPSRIPPPSLSTGIGELMECEPKDYRVNFNFKFAENDAPTISVLDAGFYYDTSSSECASSSSSSSSGSRTTTTTPKPEKKILFSGLRFSIGTKSRICLVGANGSGKTTLLKLLTGRVDPTEGVVSFHRLLRLGGYWYLFHLLNSIIVYQPITSAYPYSHEVSIISPSDTHTHSN